MLVVGGHLDNLIDHEKTRARAQCAENNTEEAVQTIHVIHGPLNSEAARIIRTELNDASSSKQYHCIAAEGHPDDANIPLLNDLINTRLPPPLEEEGEDDEDDQEQLVMVPDPNHKGRLIV
ncbi:hypothetical protein RHMOL_Rhmol06G0125000 [Rhododendron molle]|uniref:Uncharacterized protein n=1 Tax=Rhododendron molle TaxID=49168 RepID=A0ACC0NDL1_RHOML|nr:hypothetical protein RHMOL_Rhmol06G0125000 [Rhododendron molle]